MLDTLIMDILRVVTVRALEGQTWALDRVNDSPASPADIRAHTERESFINVFVDDADFNYGESPAPDTVRLVIEVAAMSPTVFDGVPDAPDQPVPPETVTQINATDAGLEMTIGFIARQVLSTLMSTRNPWAELWRMLVLDGSGVQKIEVRRGGPGDTENKALRFASRVMVLHCMCITAPPRGVTLTDYPVINGVVEALEADPVYGGIGALMRAHFEQPDEVPLWRLQQKSMLATKGLAQDLGFGPVEGFDEVDGVEFPAMLDRMTTRDPNDPADPGDVYEPGRTDEP